MVPTLLIWPAMIKMKTLLLTITLLLLNLAHAASICGAIHTEKNKIPGLFETFKDEEFPLYEEKIKALAWDLIKANQNGLDGDMKYYSRSFPGGIEEWHLTGIKLAPMREKENYHVIFAMIENKVNQKKEHIEIRTNGHVAFLAATYRYRMPAPEIKHYQAVYFKDGEIKTIDQGELILSTLPEKINLSRSMSPTERLNWLEGKPFWSHYGAKVHFAPIFYQFRDDPYLFQFTRQQIVDFYLRNELEINVYDAIGGTKAPDMVFTNLGLEFELVFIGDKAVENLRPLLREGLQQSRFRLRY